MAKRNVPLGKDQIRVDPSRSLGQWFIYPDMLPTRRFSGFQDRDDETMLVGSFVVGQNVTFGNDSLPSVRKGSEVVGTNPTDATPVRRAWVFETRDGTEFELKAYDTGVYYWLVGSSTDWSLLKGGFTAGLEFGYGNIGESGGEFHSFFCNGTEDWYQFNGANAVVASSTVNTITLSGSGTWTSRGFYGSGTRSVTIGGQEFSYTGGEGTATLTGVSPDPTAVAVAGALAVQTPRAVSALSSYKGQVAMAHDGRLHARLETKKSVWDYSKLDNPDDFTAGSLDGDGGSKDVEFGGPIVAFAKINQMAIAAKGGILKALTFQQFGDRVDSPFYQTLTPADDKGSTLGAIGQRSTFSTPKGVVMVTPDKRMLLLTGVTQNFQPEYLVLSDPIQPLFAAGDHSDACGICFDNTIWYSFKSSADAPGNDTTIVGNMARQSVDSEGQVLPVQWDMPYVGWGANDWTVVTDASSGNKELHFHSSSNSATYRVIQSRTDNTAGFTSIARTWANDFGSPHLMKRIDYLYVEAKMSENTDLNVALLFDEDGVTQQTEVVLDGNNAQYIFDDTVYNPFGASAFGSQKFGSNEPPSGTPKYRWYIELPGNTYFFNVSVQFSVDGEGQQCQVVRYAMRLAEVARPIEHSLLA